MMRWCVPGLVALAASCPAADYGEVHAILAASCIRCHGPDKAKGDLRLDTLDNIRKGGKSGPAVVPGFPDDSAIYARTSLPADDPDIMPAKGAHLSQRQLETIAAWIKGGATAASSAESAPAADPGQTVAAAAPLPAAPAGSSAGDPPTMNGAAEAPASPMAPMAPTSAMEPSASASAGGGGASFADVEAILAVSCLQCHGPNKSKAKLRLDSLQAMLSGGKSGPAVVPGSPGKSLLIQRISLSPDDSDVMPADGKVLTVAQIATIASWISAGASAITASAAPVDPNAPLHPVIPPGQTGPAAKGPPPPTKAWDPASAPDTDLDLLAKGMSPPDAKKLDALKAENIWWRPVCKNGALVELDCRQLLPASLPAQLGDLGALAPRVVWLNLAGTAISDGQLLELKSCTNLRRLHLERTTISDSGLAAVAGHAALTYLNLYGTPVTDDGILKLAPLAHLEQLFLRGTKATPDGAAKLREKIPGLTIIFDEDLPTGPLPEKKKGKGKNNN